MERAEHSIACEAVRLCALILASIALALPRFVAAAPLLDDIDAAQFNQDLQQITSLGPRIIGSPGYERTVQYLRSQIALLPNVELKEQEFQMMVPVTDRADLTLPDGRVEKVYPFWPAQVRLNTTPAQGIQGRLVYCGQASFKEIPPAELAGQIAVIESSAGAAWTQAAYFGAKAILVLGQPETTNEVLRFHEVNMPVDIPRFYLPESSPLGELLRGGKVHGQATLMAAAHWESKTASNLYALVNSPLQQAVNDQPIFARWALAGAMDPVPPGWTSRDAPGALVFSVPFESSGLVPDLAVGASQAVQTAAGLALLRDLSARPLGRPVMLYFGGGDSIQMQASRQMFMALSDVPSVWQGALAQLSENETALQSDLAAALRVESDPRRLDPRRDRTLITRISKLIETDATLELDELFRIRTAKVDTAAELAALQPRERLAEEARQKAIAQTRDELERNQVVYNALKYTIEQEPSKLKSDAGSAGQASELQMATAYVRRVIVVMNGERNAEGLAQQYQRRRDALETRIGLYQWLAGRLHRDPNPDARSNNSRLIEMLVALDLSDGSTRCGPLYYGLFQRSGNISNLQDYKDWFGREERGFHANDPACQWIGPILRNLTFEPLSGTEAPQSYLCASMAIGSEECPTFGVPGLTMLTLDDLRLRRDTPADTLDHVNVAAIEPQLRAVRALFRHAWDDPTFKGPVEIKWQHDNVEGQVVSAAPGRPVPDLPRPGFLATYYYARGATIPVLTGLPYTMGIRRDEVTECDAEGNYFFEGISKLEGGYRSGDIQLDHLAIEVYRLEKDGSISACTDLGQQVGDIKLLVDIKQRPAPLRSLVFDCREFTLVGLYDPRFLQELRDVQLIDARRNADPQRYNLFVSRQMMPCFVEPGFESFMAFRYGRIGNRLILVNMADPSSVADVASAQDAVRLASRGYSVEQLRNIPPLSLVTSSDFERIDAIRLDRYRKAGVSSELVDSLQKDSDHALVQAQTAYNADRGDDFVRHANRAWASQARVYQAAQDMANDVIRAAIFLLLLCITFSFCMERLLIGSPNIYRQLSGMGIIFTIMTIALWSFHPAFKISSSPLIIILAFAIIFMSLAVIWVVYGKFDTELKRIRSGRGSAATTSFARASVLMSAVLLGIANMRKRKFRTALTSTTIILITFAVLCFTSASRYLDAISLPTGVPTNHYGIMLRQRGWRAMPEEAMANFQAVLPGKQLVERWWNVNATDTKEVFHVVAGDAGGQAQATSPLRVFGARAVLGLSPGESRLSAIGEVIGPDFDRLENGETHLIYMARQVAAGLKVKHGDWVRMGGIDLQVAGIYDAAEFDQRVELLSGEQISPLNYTSGELDSGGRRLEENSVESLSLDDQTSGSEVANSYEHLSATEFVIVPAVVSRQLPDATLRSVAFGLDISPLDLQWLDESELRTIAAREEISGAADLPKPALIKALLDRNAAGALKDAPAIDEAMVKHVSNDLAKRFSIALFAGFSDGVKMISASNLSSVSGAGQVAIPLAIAGLIIFNTMMGSIAERRREIHVYTSLGLAPVHVGALFVAEAMTYGLIGTVFGYVIGQGIGTLFSHLGWLGGVTLNYSGTSAMLTMGLILIIVLFSALVPARLASKIAAPSIDRTWKVPLPKDGEIIAHLPFTINKTAADGALAYLAEFFAAHQEGSIGKFSSGKVEAFTFEDDAGRASRGLKTVIWLTPFDLGVRQHLMLLIHPGQYQDIYEVQVVLQRLSGDDASWYRMNRTFLTELRKQFLQWRSLTPTHMLQYVEESKRLFE